MAKAIRSDLKISLDIDDNQEQGVKERTWAEMAEIAKTLPPREFFAEGIIDSEGISIVFAPTRSYKSAFLAHIANKASMGLDAFEGVKNSHKKECDVLYLDSELYLQDWTERYRFDSNRLTVLTKEAFSQLDIDLGVDEFIGFLESKFRSGKRIIIIDNLSVVVPQMSDYKIASAYLSGLNNLLGRLKESKIEASLVLVAHTTKSVISPDFGVTTQNMGGAYAWQKPAQSVVALNKRSDLSDSESGFYVKVLENRRRNNSDIKGRNVLAFRVEQNLDKSMEIICDGIMREEECLGVGAIPNLAREDAKVSELKMTLLALLESTGLGTNNSAEFIASLFNESIVSVKKYKDRNKFPRARDVFDRVTVAVSNDASFWVESWEKVKNDLPRFGATYPMSLPKHIQEVINRKRKEQSETSSDLF